MSSNHNWARWEPIDQCALSKLNPLPSIKSQAGSEWRALAVTLRTAPGGPRMHKNILCTVWPALHCQFVPLFDTLMRSSRKMMESDFKIVTCDVLGHWFWGAPCGMPFTITLMNMSVLINNQTVRSCNYNRSAGPSPSGSSSVRKSVVFAGGAIPALWVHLRGDAGKSSRLHPESGGAPHSDQQAVMLTWEESFVGPCVASQQVARPHFVGIKGA